MSLPDAREAVIELLVAPAPWLDSESPAAGDPGAGGWRARALPGKPYVAKRETIEIIKERGDADRRLFATTFLDLHGNGWSYLVAAERCDDRWSAHDVAGGSDRPGQATNRRPGPTVDVFGQWGPGVLYVGAEVRSDREGAVATVRLTLADGTEMTEDAVGGIALFVARYGIEPDTVQMLDAHGAVLATQPAF